jgi:hypothetical protein
MINGRSGIMEVKILMEQIESSIRAFIHNEFQFNTFDFLYEADIQCALWSRLKNDVDIKIRWEIEDEEVIKKIGRRFIETSIVKAEYAQNRYDIGIIRLDSKNFLNKGERLENIFWNQKLLLAIELKYLIYGYNPNQILNKFLADRKKMSKELGNSIESGLALLFVQVGNPLEIYGKKLKPAPIEGFELSANYVRGYIVGSKEIYEVEGSL